MEQVQRVIISINGKRQDEKKLHDINRGAAKISVLLSSDIGKNEYLIGEEISTP